MTIEEYFGDWAKVIDKTETLIIMRWLNTLNKELLCPEPKNIFKAFKLCPLDKCNSVILSQDPYSQKGIATGITFGNTKEPISPSLEVIKEGVINYNIPHNHIDFDITLESWSTQGILMLNSALTCLVGKVGVHYSIWHNFMQKLIYNLSTYNSGLVWLLFGNQAKSFKKYIKYSSNIIECNHPAYYARKNQSMPSNIFIDFKKAIFENFGIYIKLYEEFGYEN